ncbi:hypothetical protein HPTD01_3739 [Halomonas sp. TD01]|nr:hypothetical protein HPTD01_3739 [Halomonas sp. TD01]
MLEAAAWGKAHAAAIAIKNGTLSDATSNRLQAPSKADIN